MIGFIVCGAVVSYTIALVIKLLQHISEVTE